MSRQFPRPHAGGHARYVPNAKDREIIRAAAPWQTHDSIAAMLGISDETMRKYYRKELDRRRHRADGAVKKSLILRAVGGLDRDWQKADVAAAIFYAKTRMGWRTKARKALARRHHAVAYDWSKLTDEEVRSVAELLEAAFVPIPQESP